MKKTNDIATRYFNKKNQLHREGDLPAIEFNDGSKQYRINGRLHRDFGKPAVIWSDGYLEWWENGKLKRVKRDKGSRV